MSLVNELEQLYYKGCHNAFIIKICENSDVPEIRGMWPEYENLLLSFLNLNSFTYRIISPYSLKKLSELAEKVIFSPELSSCIHACQQNLEAGSQPEPVVGGIPLPLTDFVTGYVAELKVFKGAGEQHSLLPLAAALIQEFCLRSGLPPITLDPDEYTCDFFFTEESSQVNPPDIEGGSLGLSLVLALFSTLTGQPLPVDIAASAVIKPDGSLIPVTGIDQKMTALKSERHYVKRFLLAVGQECDTPPAGLEISWASNVYEVLGKIFTLTDISGFTAPLDIGKTLELIKKQYASYQLEICISNATMLLSDSAVKRRKGICFTVLCCRGAAYCHRGMISLSQADFKKSRHLYNHYPDLIDRREYVEMLNSEAVSLKDVFCYDKARALHLENIKQLKEISADVVSQGENISSLSQLLCALGEFPEAILRQQEAITLFRRASVDLARNYGYLVDFYTRSGDLKKASGALYQARKYPEGKVGGGSVDFLAWYQAQLLYRKMEAGVGSRKRSLQELQQLRDRYPEITYHAPGLVHKFSGLGELLLGDTQAIDRLDKVNAFFSAESHPTYHLLAATVCIERQLILLAAGDDSLIVKDINELTGYLQSQPNIKKFFRSRLTNLERHCRKLSIASAKAAAVISILRILEDLQRNIPY